MKRPIFLTCLVLAAALTLVACGGKPTPIAVYVTPTPVVVPSATPTAADAQDASRGTALVSLPGQQGITPQPTPPPPPPGVTFGPITGPEYTPEPLHTALPPTVAVRPCSVMVTAPQVELRAAPGAGAQVTATASERQHLTVAQVTADSAGVRWAQTPQGWLPLLQNGAAVAELADLWDCQVLLGERPVKTLLGLHVLNGTRYDEVLQLVQRLKDAGIPMGTIKGLNGTEALLNEVKRISPETVTVYRSLLTADGLADCPKDIRELPDPVYTAQRWLAGLESHWSQVNADYYEYMNECPAPPDWIAQFSIEAMRIANAQGRCLLLFSFPGGNPDMQYFNQLLPAYQYAVDHECQPGRKNGIAIHAYSLQDDKLVSESDVWVALRHRIFEERLATLLPAAVDLPVYITELGIGGGTILPPCDMIVRDAMQFTYELEEDPYVKGFHLWSVGTGAQWYDITPCLPQLGDALINYYTFAP